MSDTPAAALLPAAARFVGVAVSVYDDATFGPLPRAAEGVRTVADILSARAYQTEVLSDPEELQAISALQKLLAADSFPTGVDLAR